MKLAVYEDGRTMNFPRHSSAVRKLECFANFSLNFVSKNISIILLPARLHRNPRMYGENSCISTFCPAFCPHSAYAYSLVSHGAKNLIILQLIRNVMMKDDKMIANFMHKYLKFVK